MSLMVSNFQNKLEAKIFLQVKVAAGKSQLSSSWCLFWVTVQCDVPGGCWVCCPPAGWWVHPAERKPQTRCKSEHVLTKRGWANVPLLPPTPCERPVQEPFPKPCLLLWYILLPVPAKPGFRGGIPAACYCPWGSFPSSAPGLWWQGGPSECRSWFNSSSELTSKKSKTNDQGDVLSPGSRAPSRGSAGGGCRTGAPVPPRPTSCLPAGSAPSPPVSPSLVHSLFHGIQ